MGDLAAIEVKDLWWRYPSFVGGDNPFALKGVSFEVEKEEFFGVIGPSGAGKTTLCYALTGIIPRVFKPPIGRESEHFKGEVRVFGKPAGELAANREEAGGADSRRVGLLMQDPENQFLRMDLLHEVAFGMELMGLPPDEIERRAKEALEIVGLGSLWRVADLVHPSELSGGQKQRAAIASFLALRPDVLVLDEPTSDLDPQGKLDVIRAIDNIRREHDLTLVLVEHNPEVLQRYADRVLALDSGKVVAYGPTEDVYSDVELFERYGLYASDVARIGHRAGLRYMGRVPLTVEEALEALKGRELHPLAEAEPIDAGREEVISVRGLNYWYEDGTQALKDVNLTVYEGDFLAIIGQNGSGKTTVTRVISGIYPKFKGKVTVMGKDVSDKKVARSLPGIVGYVFQNPDHQIFMRKVYDEVAYGLRNLGLGADEVDLRVKEALAWVGLSSKIDEDPMFLGKGEKRRLAVASIMAMKPRILIVDEPTTGQDFRMSEDIMSLLKKLNGQGTTVITVTHDMTLVSEYARRVVVMHRGTTVYEGPTRSFFADAALMERAGITPPMAVRLSQELVRARPGTPFLISVPEWVAALTGERVGQAAEGMERLAEA